MVIYCIESLIDKYLLSIVVFSIIVFKYLLFFIMERLCFFVLTILGEVKYFVLVNENFLVAICVIFR